MTAPATTPPVLDWKAVLVAGVAAVYGVTVTAEWAASIGCCVGEVDCPAGHYFVTAPQTAVWEAQ